MNIKEQLAIVKNKVAKGELKDAISRLRQLMEGSNAINDILAQSANLSTLESSIISGVVNYDYQYIARSQITTSVLSIIANIEENMGESWEEMGQQVLESLDEILRKHGLSEDIHQLISKHREAKKTYQCLWIDDNPLNDKMEMEALFAMGLVCRTASDPYKAYAILNEKISGAYNLPDIIIINSLERLKDNENEGIEFCEYLDQKSAFQNIPVLLHSVGFQDKLKKSNKSQIELTLTELPKNIKNRFLSKNTLIIKDLIEEVASILYL